MNNDRGHRRLEATREAQVAESEQLEVLKQLYDGFSSRRPNFPRTAIVESQRELGNEPCSIYPFLIAYPDDSEDREIYLECVKSLLTKLLLAFSKKPVHSAWVFPASELEDLNMVRELVASTLRKRPIHLPEHANINAAYWELRDLERGYLTPPGSGQVSFMMREAKRDRVVDSLLEEIQAQNWAEYKPFSANWDAVKETEVRLEVNEFDSPLRSLHERLKKCVFLDPAKELQRSKMRKHLDIVFSKLGPATSLEVSEMQGMGILFGECGVSYLRWVLELELAHFFHTAATAIDEAIEKSEIKGLDTTAAAQLSIKATEIFERLKAGEFPGETATICRSMTQVLDTELHGPLKGTGVEIPRLWRRFLYQCYLAMDFAECRQSL